MEAKTDKNNLMLNFGGQIQVQTFEPSNFWFEIRTNSVTVIGNYILLVCC